MRRKRNTLRIPGVPHRLTWRRDTSDFEVMCHTFERRDCCVDLPFTPDAIIDGGANIGATAAFFATSYRKCPVIAVEPDAENFALLCENTRDYECVRPIKAALWGEDATVYIQNPEADKWAFEVGLERPDSSAAPIPARSIGSLIDSFAPWANQLLLQLDVEGTEEQLLCGGPTPWLDRIGAILLEVHDRQARASIAGKLAPAGFRESQQGEKLVFIRDEVPVPSLSKRS
jgi:FkbM family methyltransferase